MASHITDVIEKIEVFILRAPLGKAKFWSSQASFPERNSLLVKITSSGSDDKGENLVGWGEAGQYGPPEPVASAIEHVLGPRVLGHQICPTKINEELYAISRDFGQRGTYVEAISGIDVALWDLLGKSLRTPVCRLLGGEFRKRVKVYATGCYYRHDSTDPSTIDVTASAEAAAKEALSFKESGFKAVKIKIGLLSVDDDLRRIKAIREAIGPKEEMSLMVDANHAYSVPVAKRMAKELEAFDVRWFEEPVVPEDIAGYREIRSSTTVPISGGECSFTRFGFRDLFVGNSGACLDIAQPDIAACGGISEFLKICALASTFGVTVIPHVWGSAVGLAAGLHAVAALPLSPYTANPIYLENEPVIEFDRNPNPLRDELLKDYKFELDKSDGGSLAVPLNGIGGLGIEVDEDMLKKFHVPLIHTGVVELKAQLAKQEIELTKKKEEADKLIEIFGIETGKISKEKATADKEKIKVNQINQEVTIKQKDCAEDLKKAEPALIAAQEALNTLNKSNLTELKAFGSPPSAVVMVTSAVMVLLSHNGKVPKDRSWAKAKVMMSKVDSFLDSLIKYDKENIHPNIINAINPYLNNPEFDPDFIRTKSSAAAGLCSWVINVVRFYDVFCEVEPKRRALKEANDELAAAHRKLASVEAKV